MIENRVQAKNNFHHIFQGQSASKRPYNKTPYLPALEKWFFPSQMFCWMSPSSAALRAAFPTLSFKIRIIRKVLSAWDSSSAAQTYAVVRRQTGKRSRFGFKGLLRFIPSVIAKLLRKIMRTTEYSHTQIMGTPKRNSQRQQ